MELIRSKKTKLSLDLAPLIDVVFQLLVFFMLTSSFANPAIKMVLPKATENTEYIQEVIVVSIGEKGNLFINDQPTTLNSFSDDLKKILWKNNNRSVHIKGDQEMPYKYFVQIMDLAKEAGAEQINVVHQQAQ